MISPSKGRYEMLLLQPVGPSLPMTTYIQVNRRTTAHCKAQQCECEGFRGNASFRNKFSSRHVRCALGQLKNGIGFDGIHANHLKFTSPIISHILARFINSCFIHNHFPQDM